MADDPVAVIPFRGAPPAEGEVVEALRGVLAAFDHVKQSDSKRNMTYTEWQQTYGRVEEARKVLARHDAVWGRANDGG